MHHLTIDHHNETVTITDHPSFDDAHRTLLKYVVAADYYLRPVQNTAAHTRYQLLRPADPDDPKPRRDPRITGTATITELPETGLPVAATYFAAGDARRWIGEHADKWLHGSASDPGYHHPMAVLTIAHGEAHCFLHAGTLLPEAARLGGVDDLAHLDQKVIKALRHSAISSNTNPDHSAVIAQEVQRLLPARTGDHHTAALIWYYTLIRWGATAP